MLTKICIRNKTVILIFKRTMLSQSARRALLTQTHSKPISLPQVRYEHQYEIAFVRKQSITGTGEPLPPYLHGHKVLVDTEDQTVLAVFTTKITPQTHHLSEERVNGTINPEKPQLLRMLNYPKQIDTSDADTKKVIARLPKHQDYIRKFNSRIIDIVDKTQVRDRLKKTIMNRDNSQQYHENGQKFKDDE